MRRRPRTLRYGLHRRASRPTGVRSHPRPGRLSRCRTRRPDRVDAAFASRGPDLFPVSRVPNEGDPRAKGLLEDDEPFGIARSGCASGGQLRRTSATSGRCAHAAVRTHPEPRSSATSPGCSRRGTSSDRRRVSACSRDPTSYAARISSFQRTRPRLPARTKPSRADASLVGFVGSGAPVFRARVHGGDSTSRDLVRSHPRIRSRPAFGASWQRNSRRRRVLPLLRGRAAHVLRARARWIDIFEFPLIAVLITCDDTQGKPLKVSFFGHFGSPNPGNESTLLAILSRLRSRSPRASSAASAPTPKRCHARDGIEAVSITTRVARIWDRDIPLARRVPMAVAGAGRRASAVRPCVPGAQGNRRADRPGDGAGDRRVRPFRAGAHTACSSGCLWQSCVAAECCSSASAQARSTAPSGEPWSGRPCPWLTTGHTATRRAGTT